MLIVKQQPTESGAYPPIQAWPGASPPDGYDEWPESLETQTFVDNMGFVILTVVRGAVSSYSVNEDALTAWAEAHPEEPQTMSVEDTVLELLADHEYRLCMIELNSGSVN